MSKKKDKLLLNLLEGEKYKHRVAMVNEEGTFNQHEPNSNMARMFVVMLLIHVVVIGGIIIYDFMNGEEAPATQMKQDFSQQQQPSSVLPGTAMDLSPVKGQPLEEFATYEWKSGDSIPSVAKKLDVAEEVLIKLNKVDQGRQINTNDIIFYPKREVVKAVGVGVAGVNGELARPVPAEASIAAAEVPINLTMPGEQTASFSFSPTIENELIPAPTVAPGMKVQDTPPAAVTKEASAMPVLVELPKENAAPKVEEAPPAPVLAPAPTPVVKKEVEKEVPKAIPVPRPEPKHVEVEKEKAPVKKAVIADAPPPAKKEPAKVSGSTHTVQQGETFYRIANKYGVSVAALQAANKSAKPSALRIGAKLVIPRK